MTSILYAGDDRNFCKMLEKTLASEGYRVFIAHDGEAALREYNQCQPAVIVLDILLAKLDGFEVLEAIRQREDGESGAQTPVVLLSSCRITSQYEERARGLRAQALLAKPVALDRLLRVVKKYSKMPAPAVSGRPAEMPWRGNFSELSFPHLLHQLHGLRASGVLAVVNGKKRKLIHFQDGYPKAIKSNLINECLGNSLVRRGSINDDDFSESVRRMKKGEGLQGQILVAMEVLEERALADALRQQSLDKLFEIFRWKDGRFKFETGAKLQRANALSVESSPANLIIEGVRRAFPIERIDEFIVRHTDHYLEAGGSDFYRLQEITFLPAEEELIATLDGKRRFGEFRDDDERLRRTLYGLLITEFIQLRASLSESRGRGPAASQAENAVGEYTRIRPTVLADNDPSANKDRVMRAELAKTASRLRGQNYYQMLGISEEAALSAVDNAFEQMAGRVHPDRFSGASDSVRGLAEECYELLALAHKILSDPRERAAYTMELKKGERLAAKEAADRLALDAELEFQKGEALLRNRAYEDALVSLGRALEANPEEGEYHAHYGWALYLCHPDDSGMINEAIEHVRRGVRLAGNRETSYLFLGRLYKAVGRTAAAEKLFTRAMQIKPGCVEAVRELRLINMRRSKKGLIGKLLRR